MKLLILDCRFLLALVLGLMPAFVRAETNLYSAPIWAPVDEPAVLASADQVTTAKYPDSDDATIEHKMMRVYHEDGTAECQDESYTKVLTEKGRREDRTVSYSYMLPYSTVAVVKLELIKSDGRRVTVDIPANSKESIDEGQMSANIYDPNSKVLTVNVPGVEVGDLVHVISRETVARSIIPGQYAEETVLEAPSYILHSSYEVHAPAARPLQQIVLRDPVAGTVVYTKTNDADGGTIHHWEVRNVPRMFDEPDMPPYEMVLQRLYVSTSPDWQSVSKWYWNLSLPHLETTSPEMKDTVEELTAGTTNEMDRIKDLFYFVSKKVRYMGDTLETDRPGFEPHDVNVTFAKKYGVCRDKAGLLVEMLRLAGFNAYPVLISVGTKRDPQVPDPDFNHAIVSVDLHKGDYLLMDPTDENTRDLLPSSDCNQSYLVCRPEGEDLKTSPVPPPSEHMMRIVTTGTLTASGVLEAKSQLFFDGVNDDQYRNAFAKMKPDDERRFFERNLQRAIPGAELRSLQITPTNMLDMSSPLRAELEFSAEGLTVSSRGTAMVTVPWIGSEFGILNFILDGVSLDERKYPLETDYTCGVAESVSLKLTDGFGPALALPSYAPIEDNTMSYQRTVTAGDGLLDCARQMALKTVEFTPAEYAALKHSLKALDYDARKAPILSVTAEETPAPPASVGEAPLPVVQTDAQIILDKKEMKVLDAHTATFTTTYSKKILTYAGKREAEIQVGFDPACESAKLLKGVVTSADGKRQEVSESEMHVMDAGWNASAKRYTGGKILVANLPNVEIGSTIEVSYEITSSNAPFLGGFESFQLPEAMDGKSFILTAPSGVEVKHVVTGGEGTNAAALQQQVSETNGQQHFQWDIGLVQPLPAEPQLPPSWTYDHGVIYFIGDVGSYLKTLRETMLNRSAQSSNAAALAKQLTASAPGPLEKIIAIRDYVAKTIRGAGPSFLELPLSELSAADTTLSDGYGHAADQAILIHAMLTAVGLNPEFVLASSLPPIAGITNLALTFPMPHNFAQPLVRVKVDGVDYYLNDTDEYAKLGTTSFDGLLGLDLATQQIEVLHAAPNCESKVETAYTLTPDSTGNTRLTITHKYYGEDYNSRHRYFAELQPEDRRRYYQGLVSGLSQGAHAVGDLVTQFDTYPGVEQFTADVDNYSVLDGNFFYFDLPFSPSLFAPGADRRALPLFISYRSHHEVRTEIDLPAAYPRVVMAPASQTVSAPDGSGLAQITSALAAPGKWMLTDEFDVSPAIVPPADYADMVKIGAELGRKSERVFLLEKE